MKNSSQRCLLMSEGASTLVVLGREMTQRSILDPLWTNVNAACGTSKIQSRPGGSGVPGSSRPLLTGPPAATHGETASGPVLRTTPHPPVSHPDHLPR